MTGSAAICSRAASQATSPIRRTTSAPRSASRSASKGSGAAPPEARRQHADVAPVVLIIAAEIADEVALLVADGDQHIDRHADREQQMPRGHFRRRPEGEEEAEIEGVADPFVEQRLAGVWRF